MPGRSALIRRLLRHRCHDGVDRGQRVDLAPLDARHELANIGISDAIASRTRARDPRDCERLDLAAQIPFPASVELPPLHELAASLLERVPELRTPRPATPR